MSLSGNSFNYQRLPFSCATSTHMTARSGGISSRRDARCTRSSPTPRTMAIAMPATIRNPHNAGEDGAVGGDILGAEDQETIDDSQALLASDHSK